MERWYNRKPLPKKDRTLPDDVYGVNLYLGHIIPKWLRLTGVEDAHNKEIAPAPSPGFEVSQWTLEGDFVKVHQNIARAQEQTGISAHSIRECITGRGHTAGGFLWKLTEKGQRRKEYDANFKRKNKPSRG